MGVGGPLEALFLDCFLNFVYQKHLNLTKTLFLSSNIVEEGRKYVQTNQRQTQAFTKPLSDMHW